jgi:hypothetical protein
MEAAKGFACARRSRRRPRKPLSMSPRPFAHRPVAPRCRGGASSLLRLSSAAAGRWPSPTALNEWAGRLAQRGDAADSVVALTPEATPWFTRLWPSAA